MIAYAGAFTRRVLRTNRRVLCVAIFEANDERQRHWWFQIAFKCKQVARDGSCTGVAKTYRRLD